MKLNDKQRELLQAVLDGKNVVFRYINEVDDLFEPIHNPSYFEQALWGLDTSDPKHVIEFRIQPEPVKVALFRRYDGMVGPFRNDDSFVSDDWKHWKQISEWVEIQPSE